MRKQKVQQQIFVGVGELAVGIAPLAVILVEVVVDFATDHGIVENYLYLAYGFTDD